MTQSLRVAAIQHSAFDSKTAAYASLSDKVAHAAAQGAQLVVFQELHCTAYFCQSESLEAFDHAEAIDGPTALALSQMAKAHDCVVVGSIFERRAPGLYHNTALVFERDGQLAGYYRKMHIPDDPGFYEKYYFTPGDADGEAFGFAPISTSVGRLGVLVCWDQWFPEAARLMTLAGADLLIYPTAIGWDPQDAADEQSRQLDAWITIQRAHAIANGIPVIVSNRTGYEAHPDLVDVGTQFWGHSFVAGQQGEILAQAPANEENILLTELDLSKTERNRQIWPYLRDRRIDAYQNLSKRYLL